MKIKVHRGANQIGGCITEIESASGTRIIIDLGHNLPGVSDTDPLDDEQKLQALLEGVSAIIYTHNHGDHIGFYDQVPESIPQYIGAMAREVLRTQLLHRRIPKKNPNYFKIFHRHLDALDHMRTYRVAQEFTVGDISVTPFLVNHSAADSYMLLIKCDGKVILHTGDFRDHGFTGKGLFPTLEKYIVPQKVDVLITEGTMLSRPDEERVREYDVQKEMEAIMRKHKYLFLLCSSTNFDRIVAAHNAHEATNHGVFCCDMYEMDQLKTLAEYSGKFHPMFNITDAEEMTLRDKDLIDRMCKDGFTMLIRANTRYKVWMDMLTRINPLAETVLIYSQYPGYIDPKDPAYNQYLDEFLKEQRCQIVHCHTSGHAYTETVAKVCELVNPSTAIVPIHKAEEINISDILPEEMSNLVINSDMCRNNVNFIIH